MARGTRIDADGQIYHIFKRAVGRLQIFNTDADYLIFLNLPREASNTGTVEAPTYFYMPNHWRLALRTHSDRDLGKYMHWLANAYTRFVLKDTSFF